MASHSATRRPQLAFFFFSRVVFCCAVQFVEGCTRLLHNASIDGGVVFDALKYTSIGVSAANEARAPTVALRLHHRPSCIPDPAILEPPAPF